MPVRWIGKTAEQPWPGLEAAIEASNALLREAFPTHPELQDWSLEVWGSNDWMVTTTCIDSGAQRYNGCTNTTLPNPFGGYAYTIAVRQTRTSTAGSPHALVFSGALLSACASAIPDEVIDRMLPARLGLLGGHDRPEWVQLRNRVRTRCFELEKKGIPK